MATLEKRPLAPSAQTTPRPDDMSKELKGLATDVEDLKLAVTEINL